NRAALPSGSACPPRWSAQNRQFVRSSIEEEVKANLSRAPKILISGVHFHTSTSVSVWQRFEFEIGSASSENIEAGLFFLEMREPSFYQGLNGPLLLSVLRGGIAYTWGRRLETPRPTEQWILTLEPRSSWSPSPTVFCSMSAFDGARTRYEICFGLRNFSGLYSSPVFHSASVIAAILRASVNLARLGLVPCTSIFW